MKIQLRIVTGGRADTTHVFSSDHVTIGRHPKSDLQFDPHTDLDVSTHHGALVRQGDRWMLRDLGHEKVAVLDGGLAAWPSELMDDAEVEPEPTTYLAAAGAMPTVDRSELAARLGSVVALDARAEERYRGEAEPIHFR